MDVFLSGKKCDFWDDDVKTTFVATLWQVQQKENDEALKGDAGLAIMSLLEYSKDPKVQLQLNDEPISAQRLQEEIRQNKFEPSSHAMRKRFSDIDAMIEKGCKGTLAKWPKPR